MSSARGWCTISAERGLPEFSWHSISHCIRAWTGIGTLAEFAALSSGSVELGIAPNSITPAGHTLDKSGFVLSLATTQPFPKRFVGQRLTWNEAHAKCRHETCVVLRRGRSAANGILACASRTAARVVVFRCCRVVGSANFGRSLLQLWLNPGPGLAQFCQSVAESG